VSNGAIILLIKSAIEKFLGKKQKDEKTFSYILQCFKKNNKEVKVLNTGKYWGVASHFSGSIFKIFGTPLIISY
jgi:hypothetical protein